jgi:lysophospholipase L1-like esterase
VWKKKIFIVCLLVFIMSMGPMASSLSYTGRKPLTIYLAGDSTVSTYSNSYWPRAGWGQMLAESFDHDVIVKNEAWPGRSSKSFIREGRLKRILNQIEKGDYLFIQFGHNDGKINDPALYTEPSTTYKKYLKQYIEGARKKNAIPILITPVERRRFSKEGMALNTHGLYPAAMKEVALEENVPIIDLTTKSKEFFQLLGPEKTKELFLWVNGGKHRNYPKGVRDNTHFQQLGAREIARLVTEGLEEQKLPLTAHLKASR